MRRKNVTSEQKGEVLELLRSESSVRRVARKAGLSLSTVYKIRRGDTKPRDGDSQLLQRHRDDLMPVLIDLRGIEPLGIHNYDLAVWYSRPDDQCWPIAKGQVCRDLEGTLTVSLDSEDKLEWRYLQQHYTGDPVWAAGEVWKTAMAQDVEARLSLSDVVIRRIQKAKEEKGLGWPVDVKMSYQGGDERTVGLAYAFALYDQVFSGALGLKHGPVTDGAFIVIPGLEETNRHDQHGPSSSHRPHQAAE